MLLCLKMNVLTSPLENGNLHSFFSFFSTLMASLGPSLGPHLQDAEQGGGAAETAGE